MKNSHFISKIINIYLNESSSDVLKKKYGAINYLGTQYIAPDYSSMSHCIAKLAGVQTEKSSLVDSDGKACLNEKAKKCFKYIFNSATGNTNSKKMTQKQFVKYCTTCSTRASNDTVNGVKTVSTEAVNLNLNKISEILDEYGYYHPDNQQDQKESKENSLRQNR